MHKLPLERSKEITDKVEVALLITVLVFAERHGFDGKHTPFRTKTILKEKREGDAGSGRFTAMNILVLSCFRYVIRVGVEHSHKEAVNIENEFGVLLAPIVTPLGYGNEVFAM